MDPRSVVAEVLLSVIETCYQISANDAWLNKQASQNQQKMTAGQ